MADPLLSIKQRFGIIGISRALDHALSTAVRVASTDLSVLITGESGTGKEAFSKIIHSLSARKHNQFYRGQLRSHSGRHDQFRALWP
jgi:transcriptional regulator with PAS, ATPase and Fis domain